MLKRRNSALILVLIFLLASCASTTPLMEAAKVGDIKAADDLLNKGSNVNEVTYGETPLMIAASCGKTSMVKFLLDKGANIDEKRFPLNTTALYFAALNGHADVVQILLDRGANPNLRTSLRRDGMKEGLNRTPLEAAEELHYTRIVQLLKGDRSKGYPIANSENTILLAVIDFEAKGVSRQDAMSLSEWLRTELINTNQFRVIERSAMNAILKEQAFTMTGCTDTSCAVQVGKLLSARKMLVGSVEVWNNKVFINGRIIDVEKGVAEFAHKETVNSIKELDTGAASFAKNLVRRINGLSVE